MEMKAQTDWIYADIIEKVRQHELKQKKRSIELSSCKYRNPFGFKCYIGALIPDAMYKPAMEGAGVTGENLVGKTLNLVYPGISMSFAEELQNIHDNNENHKYRLCRLTELASKWEGDE